MKKIPPKPTAGPALAAALVVLAAAAVAACSPDRPDEAEEPAAEAVPAPEAAVPVDVRDSVTALGSEVARELASTLMARLQAVLAADGPAGAVAFCSTEGLPLTAEVSRTTGFDVKRTSSRVRNPSNAPDSLERAALARFEADLAADSVPARFVQRTPDGDYRYYQPLRIQPLCVQCHGPTGELAEGVEEVLAERYPDDAATGYEVGDFRGLIRVTIPGSAIEGTSPGGS